MSPTPNQEPYRGPLFLIKLVRGVLCLAILIAGLWTIQVYTELLSGPNTRTASEMKTEGLPEASIEEGGVWQFPGLPWRIAALHVRSEEQLISQLTTWEKSTQSQAPLWTMPWGWQSIVASETARLIQVPDGGEVTILAQDRMQIAIWVKEGICYGFRWAVKAETGEWTLFETESDETGRSDVPRQQELLIPVAGEIRNQISRQGREKGTGVQFLTTNAASLDKILEGWRQAGWTVIQASETSVGVWVSCQKANNVVDALVTKRSDDGYSLTLWRVQ